MRQAVIVSGARTAVGKAIKGSLRNYRSDEMGATVVRELFRQTEGKVVPTDVDDVIIGCAMPEACQGMNIARIISLRAGLPVEVPAQTINRFCASGLQTIATASEMIVAGSADIVVAGGVETMSMVPMTGYRYSPNPHMSVNYPEFYMSMGLTAERVAKIYGISREDQDEFALRSHWLAADAFREGKFSEEIVPLTVKESIPGTDGDQIIEEFMFMEDEHLRPDSTIDQLSMLKPVFKEGGTVTAGNASPLSDGAAAVIVMERKLAEKKGLVPIVRFLGFAVAGVAPEIMGIGPVKAVPKVLERLSMSVDDIDIIELNEAFAAQAIAVIRELELPLEKVNVNGGAIALGHPLGCTGAKLTVQLLYELRRRQDKYGLVTMCVGGGQGAASVFERLN
ncbi:MAG: acetyl-CoA C-acyltransferase [Anaerolineaceae bacterium]|nr:acetyl-CoA C-acyltransferase [Anaerolineaceae bacterium]|tara:strand:+ start:10968 stop:12152 length:1185 start_codon:yes stop_codon:yes gene_type:complete